MSHLPEGNCKELIQLNVAIRFHVWPYRPLFPPLSCTAIADGPGGSPYRVKRNPQQRTRVRRGGWMDGCLVLSRPPSPHSTSPDIPSQATRIFGVSQKPQTTEI